MSGWTVLSFHFNDWLAEMFGGVVTMKAISHLQVSVSFGTKLEFENVFPYVTVGSCQN